ncbi:unnamed protein product (macronuclear) [Paramecium tetraurelia]|uniref:Peptidase C51 domain-containing protein n=1 Tax=Paramecium tetraurelia TaxID=5888 RepID=A0E1Y1_PARTE|nr:uncharacterized protein GSPATT00022469001 [Paramecium tetraurelia]CAK89298.1 unnamed protein product [Paramecium tetraurelia]|eukprot:XP_001456695.1 hypothetical protein (macronuclear) [Paramecium tetraurelia strain d4-2]
MHKYFKKIEYLFGSMIKQHPPWGSQIGVAHGGVIGYSNCEPNYDRTRFYLYEIHYKKEESGLRCDIFMGYKYQCVEFARRFFVLNYKTMFTDIQKAPDIWNLETVEDLSKESGTFPFVGFKQGGTEPPKFGDLLLAPQSQHQPWGHVAVVVGVGDGYIDLAEQNYEDAGWIAESYSRRVKVECKDGNYFVTYIRVGFEDQFNQSWDKDEVIIGWKRIIFN